jgi:hypothetical protein
MKKERRILTTYIDDDVYKSVVEESIKEGRSIAGVARRVINKAFDKRGKK